MIGFIGTSLQLQSIMKAYDQWLSKTRSILYWTTSVFSSTMMNDEEFVLTLSTALSGDCLMNHSLSQSQSYSETSGLPQMSSFWPRAP
jgi:hypothetical protein